MNSFINDVYRLYCLPRLRQCNDFVIMHIFSSTVTQVFKTIKMKPAQKPLISIKMMSSRSQKDTANNTIPLVLSVSTDKCKQFPFSGTVSNNVWRPTKEGSPLFIPRIFISGWKEVEILSSHTFLPTLLSLWVGNAIKTLRFLPTNSRSFAYHCLSEGKKLTLKIREGQ